jgi:hypothetical protein
MALILREPWSWLHESLLMIAFLERGLTSATLIVQKRIPAGELLSEGGPCAILELVVV